MQSAKPVPKLAFLLYPFLGHNNFISSEIHYLCHEANIGIFRTIFDLLDLWIMPDFSPLLDDNGELVTDKVYVSRHLQDTWLFVDVWHEGAITQSFNTYGRPFTHVSKKRLIIPINAVHIDDHSHRNQLLNGLVTEIVFSLIGGAATNQEVVIIFIACSNCFSLDELLQIEVQPSTWGILTAPMNLQSIIRVYFSGNVRILQYADDMTRFPSDFATLNFIP